MTSVSELLDLAARDDEIQSFKDLTWEGSFTEYLEMVLGDPKIIRNAFQRLYDMILSHGYEEFVEHKERLVRYHFFSDPMEGGRDAIFGLEKSLMRLVGNVKAAAAGYGTERRVLLLHHQGFLGSFEFIQAYVD